MANLSSIITPSGVATGTQGALADTAVQPNDNPTFTGVTVNGNVVTTGTVDGVDIAQAIPASLGTAAQVLTVNTGATAGEWADVGGAFSVIGTNNLAAISTLPDLSTGTDNFAAGLAAGTSLTTGTHNVALGYNAAEFLTTGVRNVAIGYRALEGTTTGGRNIAIGMGAMSNGTFTTNDADNIALGFLAASNLSSGSRNIAIGPSALDGATSVSNNIALGENALGGNLSGTGNIGIGIDAGRIVTSGQYNVMLGYEAGDPASGTSTTSGDNQILIGYRAGASTATVDNEITLGNSSITALRCQVTTITSLSDERDKTDIEPLNAGLEFVEALNPVSFTWDMRDGGKVGEADTGFIAQELQAAQNETGVTIPHLVFDANPDKLEAGYGKLIPVLVQAIKDLSEKVKTLEAKMEVK